MLLVTGSTLRMRRSVRRRTRLRCPDSPRSMGRADAKMRRVPRSTTGPFCSSKVTGPAARARPAKRKNISATASGRPARYGAKSASELAVGQRDPGMAEPPFLARALRQHLAAVDDQGLAGDVTGLRRRQEAHRPAHVLRLPDPAQRDGAEHAPLMLRSQVAEARRADVARQHRVDRD